MSMCVSTTKRRLDFLGAACFLKILALNGSCDMSMCVSTAQARTKRRPKFRGAPHKMRLVTFPCTFRLRRLAQNVGLNYKAWHFSRKFSHKMAFVICPCAFWLRRLARSLRHGVLKLLVCGIFIVNSRVNGLLWTSCYISLERSFRDPAHVLHRRSCRDPGKILCKRSLHEDLADSMSYRCLYESYCGRLLGGSCIKIL